MNSLLYKRTRRTKKEVIHISYIHLQHSFRTSMTTLLTSLCTFFVHFLSFKNDINPLSIAKKIVLNFHKGAIKNFFLLLLCNFCIEFPRISLISNCIFIVEMQPRYLFFNFQWSFNCPSYSLKMENCH